MYVKIFDNDFVFLEINKESDTGKPIWIYHIGYNTVYNKFQKQPLWVSDRRVELDVIRLDAGYIAPTIQRYEKIPGIYGSDLVYILYCDNNPQVQRHTNLVHGNISMNQIYGTADRHNSERYKIPSPPESLHGNKLKRKSNARKDYYNKIAE